jgi:hypothetical protein
MEYAVIPYRGVHVNHDPSGVQNEESSSDLRGRRQFDAVVLADPSRGDTAREGEGKPDESVR